MKSLKTFLTIKRCASLEESENNDVFFVGEHLFYKTMSGNIQELKTKPFLDEYGIIYGIRVRVSDDGDVNSMTDDKIERVLIVRTIDKHGVYHDNEIHGDDTGLTFYTEGNKFSGTLNNTFPFNDFEEVPSRYNDNLFIKIPLFYKNKTNLQTRNGEKYLYYLISNSCFDDFYPSESHKTQEKDYVPYICLSKTWGVLTDWYNMSHYLPEGSRYVFQKGLNKNIWFGCLYYLYMIKTASFFPFKDIIEGYKPVFYSSRGVLNGIEQEADWDNGVQSYNGVLRTITLKNVGNLNFFEGQKFIAFVGCEQGTVQNNSARDIIAFISDLIDHQESEGYPVEFCYEIEATVVSCANNNCVLSFNNCELDRTLLYSFKPFVFLLKQINYDYDNNSIDSLYMERNCFISADRMNIDGIKNLFPVFFSKENFVFESMYGIEYATCINESIIELGVTNFENYYLNKINHYMPYIFASNSSNASYLQTGFNKSIVRIKNNTIDWFYCDINRLKKAKNDFITDNLSGDDFNSIDCLNENNNTDEIANIWNCKKIVSLNTSINYRHQIIGDLKGHIQFDSTARTSNKLFYEFVGVNNLNENDLSNNIKFGWNYIEYNNFENTTFDNTPPSINDNNWCPLNYGSIEFVSSRAVAYIDK